MVVPLLPTLTAAAARSALVTQATPAVAAAAGLAVRDTANMLTVGSAPGWSYLGCYHDISTTPATRILDATGMFMTATGDADQCCKWCANQDPSYSYCGLEDGNQCFCDSAMQVTASNTPAAASECNWSCKGNAGMQCGGVARINIYSATVNLTSQGTASTTTIASVPGYKYLGCVSDSTSRALSRTGWIASHFNDPVYCCEQCLNADNGNVVCGVEDYWYCFCDYNTVVASSLLLFASASECNMNCAGMPDAYCGGPFRLNVYHATAVTTSSAASSSSQPATNTDTSPTTSTTTLPADTNPPSNSTSSATHSGLHSGAIAGIVIGALAAVAIFAGLAYFAGARRWKKKRQALETRPPSEVLGDSKHGYASPGPYAGPYQLDDANALNTNYVQVPTDTAPGAPTPIYELHGYQAVPQEARHD
ncbi:hypothetical protein SEUCBS139899_003017 [Sporothrix eucalyptigena]|uniref:WSC domain-containing protein n=1 Tax=Sporothrix eucalyptigena TaxID=1812306 RepID=A0ABP0CUZ6_9PEZI